LEVLLHVFLTFVLNGDEQLAASSGRFMPTHLTGGCVGIRAKLDVVASERGQAILMLEERQS
jgi:hypothetical protein